MVRLSLTWNTNVKPCRVASQRCTIILSLKGSLLPLWLGWMGWEWGWGRGLNLSLTCSVPVDMGDVTGCCFTCPHPLLRQHIVNVHKVVMGCHSQVPSFLWKSQPSNTMKILRCTSITINSNSIHHMPVVTFSCLD